MTIEQLKLARRSSFFTRITSAFSLAEPITTIAITLGPNTNRSGCAPPPRSA